MTATSEQDIEVTGAESLLMSATWAGIEMCFANPGTTEMPIVTALDSVPGIRSVLCLHENVCTGAADGYARMGRRPALTLLHLGPGLANGLANLHNARRAGSAVVNLVGDHASWHLPYDAPLTSDIDALAATVGAVHTAQESRSLAGDLAGAVETAVTGRAVSTLVVPADFQQQAAPAPATGAARREAVRRRVQPERIASIASLLEREGEQVVLILGGDALSRPAQEAAGRIAEATQATLFSETFPARAERGGGLPAIDRLPYFPEAAIDVLRDRHVVLVGAPAPVAYFGYEGLPSLLAAEGLTHLLSSTDEDGEQAIVDLAVALNATRRQRVPAPPSMPDPSVGLTGSTVGSTVAALLPAGAIVSVEGGTCGYPFFTASAGAAVHTSLTNTGGAIGQGLPVALGAAMAEPERPVIALQSDGSALYTAQALWSMARERCNVVVLIAANHVYNVLRTELRRHGNDDLGPQARALTDLGEPTLDWVALAAGFGVPASRAQDVGALADQLTTALAAPGPHLIEMAMS